MAYQFHCFVLKSLFNEMFAAMGDRKRAIFL